MRWILLFVTMSVSAATNLLENSSFEAGDLRGWSHGIQNYPQTEPWRSTNEFAFHGAYSLKLEHAQTNGQNYIVASKIYHLQPSTAYTISFYAKAATNNTVSDIMRVLVHNSRSPTYGGDADLNFGFAITKSWARYITNFTTAANITNTFYYINVGSHYGLGSGSHFPGQHFFVDAFQMEQGTNATSYAPMTDFEYGPVIDRSAPGQVYFDTNSIPLSFIAANNTGATIASNVLWSIHDFWNNRITNGSFSMSVPANGRVTNTLSLNLGRGAFRCLSYVSNLFGSINESTFSVVPVPVVLSHRTNGMFGSHIPETDYWLGAAQRIGIHWNRDFSVENHGRWALAEPVEGTLFVETNKLALNRTYDIEPLMILGAHSGGNIGQIPSWVLTNAAGFPTSAQWFNFVTNIVTAYKPWVKYWGAAWNEQAATNSNFQFIFTNASRAVRTADATAVIATPDDFWWATTVSNLLVMTSPTNLDIGTTHIYDGNTSANERLATLQTMAALTSFGKVGWNTETGLRSDTWETTAFNEHVFQDGQSMQPDGDGFQRNPRYALRKVLLNVIYTLRPPTLEKYFYYEFRTTTGYDYPISYSIADIRSSLKPYGPMFAWLAKFLETGTSVGNVTLTNKMDGWLWTRGTNSLIVTWVTNVVVDPTSTVIPKYRISSTNAFVAYDIFGNVLASNSTVTVGLDPVFLEGGAATNVFANGFSLVQTNDAAGPKVIFGTYPTSAGQDLTFRWSGVDDVSLDTRWVADTNAIQYSYKLTGVDSDFSPYTNASWVVYPGESSFPYTFTLLAKDAAGNTTTETLSFESPPTPLTLNVGVIQMTPPPPSSLNTNLIAYWKLDEASGTRVDSEPTGTAQDLTDVNTVTSAAGIIGNAGSFAVASSEILTHIDSTDLSTGDIDFTIVLWVRFDTEVAQYLASHMGSSGNRSWAVFFPGTLDRMTFRITGGGVNLTDVETAAINPTTGTWYMVTCWHDSVNNQIGIQINNETPTVNAYTTGCFDSTADIQIGGCTALGPSVNGRLDEIGFWKKVLTSDERTALWAANLGETCCPFTP